MRRFLTTVLVGLAVSRCAQGQPVSIYNNYETIASPPTIDAVIFENSGYFNVSTIVNLSNITSTAIGFGTSPLPFATRDTRYWTNSSHGT